MSSVLIGNRFRLRRICLPTSMSLHAVLVRIDGQQDRIEAVFIVSICPLCQVQRPSLSEQPMKLRSRSLALLKFIGYLVFKD